MNEERRRTHDANAAHVAIRAPLSTDASVALEPSLVGSSASRKPEEVTNSMRGGAGHTSDEKRPTRSWA